MKNLLLVLCLVVFCLQAEAALSATDQNLEGLTLHILTNKLKEELLGGKI